MIDLISRQAAIDAVDNYIGMFDAIDANFLDGLKTAKQLMTQLPSAQPRIVRCEDCKHYDDGLCRRWKYSHVTSEDSFCFDAERRNEWEE